MSHCYQCLSKPGNSRIMYCGILFDMPCCVAWILLQSQYDNFLPHDNKSTLDHVKPGSTCIFIQITHNTQKHPASPKNIEYMYPVVGQRYVLPKESNVGYVQLEKGQDYLFGTPGFKDELFFVTENGQKLKAQFSYNNASNQLSFTLPKLPNQTHVTYALITSKSGTDSNSNSTIEETFTQIDDNVSISQNTLSGDATNDVFLTVSFVRSY